jgi:AraC-like DNA-binding protein
MAERGTFTFCDPEGYVAGFGDVRVTLTITGAGDFKARLTRLKLKDLDLYRCCESLPRIAYVSLPPERVFLSFLAGTASLVFDGFALRNGDIVWHSRGDRLHQRSSGECQWGLISLSPEQLASYSKALTGRPIAPPQASRILRAPRAEVSRFRRIFRQACHLAGDSRNLIEHPEVARALEQTMLHALTHCLAASDPDGNPKMRRRHAAAVVRFEDALSRCIDQKISLPELCAEIGVQERTLRTCCAEFLGVSPARYLLLQRLNKARSALQRADASKTSVAEVARNHQFLELGRFAVTYHNTFGELPSTTLQRASQNVKIA